VCCYYIDGQKIAIRLSRRINVVSKQLKTTINRYNVNQPPSIQVQWKDATDLSNDIYKGAVFTSSSTPHYIKAQAVELLQKISRCKEEITRLDKEMKCCSQHFITKYKGLNESICALESAEIQGGYTKGSICLLKRSLHLCRFELQSLNCLMEYTHLPELETILMEFCRDGNVCDADVDATSVHENDASDHDDVCLRIPEQVPYSSDDESIYDEGKYNIQT